MPIGRDCGHESFLPGRRRFLRSFACGCAVAASGGLRTLAAPGNRTDLTAEQALAALVKGNDDFMHDHLPPVAAHSERRLQIAQAQTPFVVLVGCSDSRVSPELLFGRGLGEMFTVRTAGNSVDRLALGSVEYGVADLGCPLIVVLGHERCGAVQAAIQVVQKDVRYPGAIGDMVAPIIPAVLRAQRMAGELVANAVRENVKRVVADISMSGSIIEAPLSQGKLKITGAYYSFDNGRVDFLT